MADLPGHPDILDHFDRNDPTMAQVIRDIGPFRLRANRQTFQVLARAIVSQQISTKAADSIFTRFCGLFENRRPTADRVAAHDEDALRSAGLSRQKVLYLKDLSGKFIDGTLTPRRFSRLDNEEIIGQLVQVKGIGRWTAEMFLIFSLNRLNVLPVDDLGLKQAVRQIYRMRQLPTVKRLRLLGSRWHPYETVGTWYAWRSLNPEIVKY
jgi:DNA-3-methyladenine glycosylase II